MVLAMKLRAYLKSASMTQKTLADRVGVTQQTVDLWVRGLRIPRRGPMLAIWMLTDKHVGPNDFYDIAA